MRLPYKDRLENDRLVKSKKYRGDKSRAYTKEGSCQHKHKKKGKKLQNYVEKPQNKKIITQKEWGGDQIKIGRAIVCSPYAVGAPLWIFIIGDYMVRNEVIPIDVVSLSAHREQRTERLDAHKEAEHQQDDQASKDKRLGRNSHERGDPRGMKKRRPAYM